MKLKGTIKLIRETKQVTEKFKVREFVLNTDEDTDYPQTIAIQTKQDKTSMLDNYSEGDLIEVEINLEGREHNGNYYNNLSAWRITKLEATTVEPDLNF